uniref:Homeobox protein knotted-1-like 3 n=1 Tax=Cannabis sativa TaxID=3483 RepID=A0A803NM55_CANSA
MDQQQQQSQNILPDQLAIAHSSPDPTSKSVNQNNNNAAPNWLNNALLRTQTHAHFGSSAADNNANGNNHVSNTNFLNLHTASDSPNSGQASNQWLTRPILQRNHSDNARNKAEIISHPLYDQLLSAHVACLRIATPVDQLPRIDAQLDQSQNVVAKYSALSQGLVVDDKELDQFMTHYVLLLCSFKEQLQQHVRVHAMEAVMACWEIEQSLQSLTGVSPGEGTGATMSDDDDDQVDSDANLFDGSLDGPDSMGFGPLIPTESERSLMERVRQELKHELKQGYKEKIVDIREEILRKRRAGKLPGDTTSVLKAWWQSHSKWPYPTEEDKARLVQETGLQLKQINNWFINQRKRNWHSNPSTSTVLKSKRKRNVAFSVVLGMPCWLKTIAMT